MVMALWPFWRSHAGLGKNWSVRLEIRDGHKLVAHGVYRFVRHARTYHRLLCRSITMITCYLRYKIDMYKISAFEIYARMWIPLVERFGGVHHGYYLPHESNSDLAVALFSFTSLAGYEAYRTKSVSDPECQAAYAHAEKTKCIISYERQFLRPVKSL